MNAEQMRELSLRVAQLSGERLNEEQTKNALVLPFLKALGYDIFNPFEVCAEFVSDVGTKKGERIDYAILHRGNPIILIECKPRGDCLDKGRCSQLRRYFQNHVSAKIGILTDGVRYYFFTDSRNKNLMDDEPFVEINFLDFDAQVVESIGKLRKENMLIDEFIRMSSGIRQKEEIKSLVMAELDNPSDEFVRLIASKTSQPQRITTKAIETLKPMMRKVIDGVIAEKLNQRIDSMKVKHADTVQEDADISPGSDIYTTNTEMWGFLIVRTLLHDVVDPIRIDIRDKKSYCGILLDDNNRKPICRFYNFKDWDWGDSNIGDKAYVHIFHTEAGEKFPLQYVDDLYPLKGKLVEAVRRY